MRTLVVLCSLVLTLAPASGQTPTPAPPSQTFDEFLADVRAEGLTRGISAATLDAVLTGMTPEPVVIARDRAQPEATQSLEAYVDQRLTTRTITTAREMATKHAKLLTQVETQYSVPPALMIAIWGLESNFGRFTGGYSTVRALATLAFDARRALFRTELFNALTIIDRGQVTAADLKGSWAGAIGQPQFMPSSFLKHAVDFDGDGRIDLWTAEADVFGSMGKYLSAAGWKAGERWGREVLVSRDVLAEIDRTIPRRATGCRAVRELTELRPLAAWADVGVTLMDGTALPESTIRASLMRGRQRSFLVYGNYEAILDYNCSNAYAVSVGLLADKVVTP